MTEAERRLAEARLRVDEMFSAIQAARGVRDWDGLRAARQEVLTAEREVARIAGRRETGREIDGL